VARSYLNTTDQVLRMNHIFRMIHLSGLATAVPGKADSVIPTSIFIVNFSSHEVHQQDIRTKRGIRLVLTYPLCTVPVQLIITINRIPDLRGETLADLEGTVYW